MKFFTKEIIDTFEKPLAICLKQSYSKIFVKVFSLTKTKFEYLFILSFLLNSASSSEKGCFFVTTRLEAERLVFYLFKTVCSRDVSFSL